MQRADIKLGFSCNNNCIHCVVADKRGKFKDRTFAEIKLEIKNAKKKGCEEIVFTGGEPTIRKDILKIINNAKEVGFKNIQIQTNGRMLSYKKFCENVIKSGANDFVVAVHGYLPEQHDYITGNKGNFMQTIAGLKNLINFKQKVAINVVVTKSNYRNLVDIAKLLVKLKVNQFQFAFVHPLGNAYKNFYSIVPHMTLIEPYIKKGLMVGINAGISVMTEAVPYCFMSGYEAYVAEKIIPQTMIFDVDNFINDYQQQRVNDGKKKFTGCLRCKYNSICEGPWREYPEKFGIEEFKPIIINNNVFSSQCVT